MKRHIDTLSDTGTDGINVCLFGHYIDTGEPHSVTVRACDLQSYRRGALIQHAFPTLSPDDREFLLTGLSPEGFPEGLEDTRETEDYYSDDDYVAELIEQQEADDAARKEDPMPTSKPSRRTIREIRKIAEWYATGDLRARWLNRLADRLEKKLEDS